MNLRKVLITFFLINLALIDNAKADFSDGFLLKSAITLDVQFPHIAGNSQNSQFKNDGVWSQIKGFENIAVGAHLRVHKYLGFNLNWAHFTQTSSSLEDITDLNKKANLSLQTINLSSLIFVPLIGDNLLEGFIELGVSNVQSKLKYSSSSTGFVSLTGHETVPLYGVGIQFAPYERDTVFRLSVQKYNTKLAPLNSDLVIWRAGVVQYF
jgi:hypothetical protein